MNSGGSEIQGHLRLQVQSQIGINETLSKKEERKGGREGEREGEKLISSIQMVFCWRSGLSWWNTFSPIEHYLNSSVDTDLLIPSQCGIKIKELPGWKGKVTIKKRRASGPGRNETSNIYSVISREKEGRGGGPDLLSSPGVRFLPLCTGGS